jgi:hypothetical protein
VELSEAVSVLEQMNQMKFCRAFGRLFDNFFHVNDLQFWCELTGTEPKTVLKIFRKQGWKRLGKEIFVRSTIRTMDELAVLCNLFNLKKQDMVNAVVYVMEMNKGYLPRVLNQLPISYDVARILLELQDVLIPVTQNFWLPKSGLPDPLKVFSRNAHFQRNHWDELIIATFVRAGKPLRLEELIYQCMGVIPVPIELKRMFTFMLNLLPVSKIDETEYWTLLKWEQQINLTLIDDITTLLTEQGALPLDEIIKGLIDYEEMKIYETLAFWPEFVLRSDKTYWLNISSLDDELLAIIVPALLKHLSEGVEGIPTLQLYKFAEAIANSYGLNMHARDFKPFLKGWGEVAIVGNRVYAMQKAPFLRMRLGDVAYLILMENGAPMSYTELEAEIRQRRKYYHAISSVFLTEPKLSRPTRGYWALREWGLVEYDPQIHNRIGEVLVSIIEQTGRPVHKTEIRRQLRHRGMNMNDGTLHLDLTENERIHQVARGVYALTEWNLSFRDMFQFKFPFRLVLPDGNPAIYELENGIMIEYFITKYCLEAGRILVKRYINEYFPGLEQYTKYRVTDFTGAMYEGWVDRMTDEGRYQLLGLKRWYKTHKPRYGESIYLYIPKAKEYAFSLLTAEQADVWLYEGT